MRTLLFAALMFASSSLIACQFNTDCSPGSRCVKGAGSLYGVCAGGIMPGNTYDQQPVYAPLDPNRTVGNTCNFNPECGPGSVCLKSSGSIQGVCVRSR